MKANELRIGNWVHNPLQAVDLQVDARVISSVVYDNKTHINPKYRFQPIPLTEEWLLKFGFEKRIDGNRTLFEKSHLNGMFVFTAQRDNDKFRLYIMQPQVAKTWTPFAWFNAHVHLLQNIYFVLAGEELTII